MRLHLDDILYIPGHVGSHDTLQGRGTVRATALEVVGQARSVSHHLAHCDGCADVVCVLDGEPVQEETGEMVGDRRIPVQSPAAAQLGQDRRDEQLCGARQEERASERAVRHVQTAVGAAHPPEHLTGSSVRDSLIDPLSNSRFRCRHVGHCGVRMTGRRAVVRPANRGPPRSADQRNANGSARAMSCSPARRPGRANRVRRRPP